MISSVHESENIISVLVAESCAMSCELMAAALERNGSGLAVVASATDTSEVINSYVTAAPDICIVGANLKDGVSSGFKATRELREQSAFSLERNRSKSCARVFKKSMRANIGSAIGRFNISWTR